MQPRRKHMDNSELYAKIGELQVRLEKELRMACEKRKEIDRLNGRVAILEKWLEDEKAMSNMLMEQRDDYHKKFYESERACCRIAGERNRLKKELEETNLKLHRARRGIR